MPNFFRLGNPGQLSRVWRAWSLLGLKNVPLALLQRELEAHPVHTYSAAGLAAFIPQWPCCVKWFECDLFTKWNAASFSSGAFFFRRICIEKSMKLTANNNFLWNLKTLTVTQISGIFEEFIENHSRRHGLWVRGGFPQSTGQDPLAKAGEVKSLVGPGLIQLSPEFYPLCPITAMAVRVYNKI